jgi:hypothetical protein
MSLCGADFRGTYREADHAPVDYVSTAIFKPLHKAFLFDLNGTLVDSVYQHAVPQPIAWGMPLVSGGSVLVLEGGSYTPRRHS